MNKIKYSQKGRNISVSENCNNCHFKPVKKNKFSKFLKA